jgi:hypothetical protein
MKTLLALALLFAFPLVADAVPVTIHAEVTVHEPTWQPPVAEVYPLPAWLEAYYTTPGLTSEPEPPLAHTPEPATAFLLGTGLALVAGGRMIRRRWVSR